MLRKQLPFLIILTIVLGITVNTQPTYGSFCEGRIVENQSSFTANDINVICSYISGDDRFILRFIDKKFIDSHLYERDNREFFTKHCRSISTRLCEEGYGVSIYTNDIQTLSIHSQFVSDFEHIKAMTKEDIEITNGNIITSSALIRLVQRLQQLAPSTNKENSHTIYDDKDNTGQTHANQLVPLLIFIIVVVPLIFICFVISSLMRIAYMPEPTVYSPAYIHEHLSKIKDLYDTLTQHNNSNSSTNSTPHTSLTTNKCLICFGDIILQISQMCFEMKDLSTNTKPLLTQADDNVEMPIDTANIRFCCGHVYHSSCLHNKNIKCCMMCQDDNEHRNSCDIMINTIANKTTKQVIMKRHVIRFILNFNLLYEQNELEHHAKVYKNELHKLRESVIRSSL